jgi:hypothetical protein
MNPWTHEVIRGKRVTIKIHRTATSGEIVLVAKEQFVLEFPKFVMDHVSYTLRYPDGSNAEKLKKSGDFFSLCAYKEMIMKDYAKICLFIAAEGKCFAVLFTFTRPL